MRKTFVFAVLVLCLAFPQSFADDKAQEVAEPQPPKKCALWLKALKVAGIALAGTAIIYAPAIQDEIAEQKLTHQGSRLDTDNYPLEELTVEQRKQKFLALAAYFRNRAERSWSFQQGNNEPYYVRTTGSLLELLKEPLPKEMEEKLKTEGRNKLDLSSEKKLRDQLGIPDKYLENKPIRLKLKYNTQDGIEQMIPPLKGKVPGIPVDVDIPLDRDHFAREMKVSPDFSNPKARKYRQEVDARLAAWMEFRFQELKEYRAKDGSRISLATFHTMLQDWGYDYRDAVECEEHPEARNSYKLGIWMRMHVKKETIESGALYKYLVEHGVEIDKEENLPNVNRLPKDPTQYPKALGLLSGTTKNPWLSGPAGAVEKGYRTVLEDALKNLASARSLKNHKDEFESAKEILAEIEKQ